MSRRRLSERNGVIRRAPDGGNKIMRMQGVSGLLRLYVRTRTEEQGSRKENESSCRGIKTRAKVRLKT